MIKQLKIFFLLTVFFSFHFLLGKDKEINKGTLNLINKKNENQINRFIYSVSPTLFASAYSYHVINSNIKLDNIKPSRRTTQTYRYKIREIVEPSKKNTINYELNETASDLGSGTYLIPVLAYLTYYYSVKIVFGNISFIKLKKYHHQSAIILIETIIIGNIVIQGLKIGIGRRRPYVKGEKKRFRSGELSDSGFHSFPSGHTFTAFSLASVLSLRYGYSYIWIPLVMIVAYSRVALEKHYFTDIFFSAVYTMNLVELFYGP